MFGVPSIVAYASIGASSFGREILDFDYVMPSSVGHGTAVASLVRDAVLSDPRGRGVLNISREAQLDPGIAYRASDFTRPFRVVRANRIPSYGGAGGPDYQDPGFDAKRRTEMYAAYYGRESYVSACSIPYGEQCVPSLEMPFNQCAESGRLAFGECFLEDLSFIPECLSPFAGRWFQWCGVSANVDSNYGSELALLTSPVPEIVRIEQHSLQVIPKHRKLDPHRAIDFKFGDTNSHSRKVFDLNKRASVVLCAQLNTIEHMNAFKNYSFLVGERGVRTDCVHVQLSSNQWHHLNYYLNSLLRAHRFGKSVHLGLLSDLLTLLYDSSIHFAPCINLALSWLNNAELSPLDDIVRIRMASLEYQPKLLV